MNTEVTIEIPFNLKPLTAIFEELNKEENNQLFDIDGNKITPRDNRTRIFFIMCGLTYPMGNEKDSYLYGETLFKEIQNEDVKKLIEDKFRTYKLIKVLPESFVFRYHDSEPSSLNAIKKYAKDLGDDTLLCIQQKERPVYTKMITSSEELGELISMLYFKQKGYIVSKPRCSYGKEICGGTGHGVDDVVAWKSPRLLPKLRAHGFIDKGCHLFELPLLRWLGPISQNSTKLQGDDSTEDLILIEVKSHESLALNKGIEQLFNAEKTHVAHELFICFPSVNENIGQLKEEINDKGDSKINYILFDKKGIQTDYDEVVGNNNRVALNYENMSKEIEKLEKEAIELLLYNFDFEEIIGMMKDFNITFHKRMGETIGKDILKILSEKIMEDMNTKSENNLIDIVLEKIKTKN